MPQTIIISLKVGQALPNLHQEGKVRIFITYQSSPKKG
jgi:hypothetical protein